MTREPYFYRELYQNKFWGDDTKIFQIFGGPIGNKKITRKLQFHLAAPVMKYHQNTYNSCCLSSLASTFQCINDNRAVIALVNGIEESLILQTENYKDIIHFANTIMKNIRKKQGEHNLRYNLTIWRENDAFDILNDISENVTLIQLMDHIYIPGNNNNNNNNNMCGHTYIIIIITPPKKTFLIYILRDKKWIDEDGIYISIYTYIMDNNNNTNNLEKKRMCSIDK